jgi:hypothetical protein
VRSRPRERARQIPGKRACRRCGLLVVWAKDPAGDFHPINPEPVWDGNVRLSPDGARCCILPRAEADELLLFGRELYVHHRTTCGKTPTAIPTGATVTVRDGKDE